VNIKSHVIHVCWGSTHFLICVKQYLTAVFSEKLVSPSHPINCSQAHSVTIQWASLMWRYFKCLVYTTAIHDVDLQQHVKNAMTFERV
jgi:hypothetical protein